MSTLTLTEKIFLLREAHAFEGLYDSELGPIAEACRVRVFEPGEVVVKEGHPVTSLHVIASGRVIHEEFGALPSVFGATSLLTGQALESSVKADPDEGATCLLLSQPHFFTLVNECPSLLLNLLNDWRVRRSEP